MLVISLSHAHYPLMSHGSNRCKPELLRQVHITCTYELGSRVTVLSQYLYRHLLCFGREPSSETELTESPKIKLTCGDSSYLLVQPVFK